MTFYRHEARVGVPQPARRLARAPGLLRAVPAAEGKGVGAPRRGRGTPARHRGTQHGRSASGDCEPGREPRQHHRLQEAFWISYHSDHFEIRPCSVQTMVEQTGTDRFFTITSRNTHTYIMCGCVQHMCICIICTCIHIYSETDQNGLRTGRNQNGFRNSWNRPLRYIYVYIYIEFMCTYNVHTYT